MLIVFFGLVDVFSLVLWMYFRGKLCAPLYCIVAFDCLNKSFVFKKKKSMLLIISDIYKYNNLLMLVCTNVDWYDT